LARGWEVVALDNFVTGSEANLAHLGSEARFHLERADVSRAVPALDGPVTAVFHLASPASPKDFDRLPVEILEVGTAGTRNLLELAAEQGARFLLASTSEVYGDPEVHPQPESYLGSVNTIGVRGCYDEAKRCAEAYAAAYRRSRGVEVRIARIFNTFGPRMRPDDGRVIPNFAAQALRGRPITVYGDGSQTRSLCFVTDLVAGLLAVFERGDGLPYNVGSDHELTVLELAEAVRRAAGSESEVEHRDLPSDDPRQRRPDLTRVRSLGWEPRVPFDQGLRETLDYFRSILQ
jgi:dTDP-glucose 4,6-dehydratase